MLTTTLLIVYFVVNIALMMGLFINRMMDNPDLKKTKVTLKGFGYFCLVLFFGVVISTE